MAKVITPSAGSLAAALMLAAAAGVPSPSRTFEINHPGKTLLPPMGWDDGPRPRKTRSARWNKKNRTRAKLAKASRKRNRK